MLFLIFDAHSFLPDHCVGLFLDFGSAVIVRRRFFSVLVVTDGDSECVSFFGRASFVLYLRSVEDRMCTWDQQKCVNALHALLDIGSTVKSIPPNTKNWLRKRYDENYNNDTSNETKRETNYSINNKCNGMNTRNMHIP